MNHSELVKRTADITGFSMAMTDRVISTAILVMAAELRENTEVNLKGLGKLKKVSRPARPGRNPRTGDAVAIPARKGVKFKVSKSLVL